MGKIIHLNARRTHTRGSKCSLPAVRGLAKQSKEAIASACSSLATQREAVQRRGRGNYQPYLRLLQTIHEMQEQSSQFQLVLEDIEGLPLAIHVLRYPLLLTLHKLRQQADDLATRVIAAYAGHYTFGEEIQVDQKIIRDMVALAKIGKDASVQITTLLEESHSSEQQFGTG